MKCGDVIRQQYLAEVTLIGEVSVQGAGSHLRCLGDPIHTGCIHTLLREELPCGGENALAVGYRVTTLLARGWDVRVFVVHIYELAGDEAWTFSELAAEISRQTGREIRYTDLPLEEFAKILTGAGLPVRAAESVAARHVVAGQGLLKRLGSKGSSKANFGEFPTSRQLGE